MEVIFDTEVPTTGNLSSESDSAERIQKSRRQAAVRGKNSLFNKKLHFAPPKVPSAEYDEPRREVHRIRIFFKSHIPLPGRFSIVYQYNGAEIYFSHPPFYAHRAF